MTWIERYFEFRLLAPLAFVLLVALALAFVQVADWFERARRWLRKRGTR